MGFLGWSAGDEGVGYRMGGVYHSGYDNFVKFFLVGVSFFHFLSHGVIYLGVFYGEVSSRVYDND